MPEAKVEPEDLKELFEPAAEPAPTIAVEAPPKTPGEALDAAVAEFEGLFGSVDEQYLHGDNSRTKGGTRFRRVIPGTPDVTKPVPYQEHAICAMDWLSAAIQVKETMIGKQLLWRIRPHFINLAEGGFTIQSAFAVEAEVAPETESPKV